MSPMQQSTGATEFTVLGVVPKVMLRRCIFLEEEA